MSRVKDVTLSIRTSPEIRQLLRLAAEQEHRSSASMIEVLVLEYARKHNLQLDKANSPSESSKVRAQGE